MSKNIEFELNLVKIWPKQNKEWFQLKCEILIILLQNVSNGRGYVGGGVVVVVLVVQW